MLRRVYEAKHTKNLMMSADNETAKAFADSWNNLPGGSVYTKAQFEEWLYPLTEKDITNKNVLEMGCGNGSLLVHIAGWKPLFLEGVDLGASVRSAIENMQSLDFKNWEITQADLTQHKNNTFDIVYCIGVLHHLKNPKDGLDAIISNTKKGGKFHCWVYAKEGNTFVIWVVDPIRKVVSKFPWWVTKYFVATPLSIPFYIYAKSLSLLKGISFFTKFPLYEYSLWIAKRDFLFFRHVAFDQLVTPQTIYIDKKTIEEWMMSYENVDKENAYIIMRNGNSWKFGGRIK